MKYYAIKDNDKSEIYNSWEECQESIKTFNNPKYNYSFDLVKLESRQNPDCDLWIMKT